LDLGIEAVSLACQEILLIQRQLESGSAGNFCRLKILGGQTGLYAGDEKGVLKIKGSARQFFLRLDGAQVSNS